MALDTASLDEQLGELKQQTQHVLLLKHKTRKEERTHLATRWPCAPTTAQSSPAASFWLGRMPTVCATS